MKFRNKKTGEIQEFTCIEINSSLVSAQNRKRLYWTNIPNVIQPKDLKITLESILEQNHSEEFYLKNRKGSIAYVLKKYDEFYGKNCYHPKFFNPYNCSEIKEKAPTLTAQGSRIGVSSSVIITGFNGERRSLTPMEWERLQTLPIGYTEGLSNTHRYNVIGNGWTVDVIAHILSHIKTNELPVPNVSSRLVSMCNLGRIENGNL